MTMTRSQIERLGARLVGASPPTSDDLRTLHELLLEYGDALANAVTIVREYLGVTPTARVKSTGTILEKLERYGGSWLKSIQDIAGMRIVGSFDRAGQDEIVARLVSGFDHGSRRPRVVDRRHNPSHGYTAVHVIAYVDGAPVEIQVRTQLQHEWADLFEKLADKVGRGIRYGEPPDRLSDGQLERRPPAERPYHLLRYAIREEVVKQALELADMIATVEAAEQAVPDAPQLATARRFVRERLDEMRAQLERL